MGGWWRWALVSPDGVVGVCASVSPPLHHEVQKFYCGTGSPGWSRKKDRKTVVAWCGTSPNLLNRVVFMSHWLLASGVELERSVSIYPYMLTSSPVVKSYWLCV